MAKEDCIQVQGLTDEKNGSRELYLGTEFNSRKTGSRELYLGREFISKKEWI